MSTKNETDILDCVVVEPVQAARSSVIWLHGLGADGHDFEPIVPHIRLPESAAVRFVFPHAPIRPVTINNGYEMRAWYDITSPDIADKSRADAKTIGISVQQMRALIAQEIAKGIPPERIVLAGFSQGGVIAIETALQYEQPLAGLMVLSSYVALPDQLSQNLHQANQQIPVFLAHGVHDAVLPYTLAEQTQQHLQAWAYPFNFFSYPMEHNVCAEEIADMSNWLSQLDGIL